MGWVASLALTLLLASIFGLVFALVLRVTNRAEHESMLPFGPSLAFGGLASILYREGLVSILFG